MLLHTPDDSLVSFPRQISSSPTQTTLLLRCSPCSNVQSSSHCPVWSILSRRKQHSVRRTALYGRSCLAESSTRSGWKIHFPRCSFLVRVPWCSYLVRCGSAALLPDVLVVRIWSVLCKSHRCHQCGERGPPLFSLLSLVASGLGFSDDGDGREVLFLTRILFSTPD